MASTENVRRTLDRQEGTTSRRSFRRSVGDAAARAREAHHDTLAEQLEALAQPQTGAQRMLTVSSRRSVPVTGDDLPLVAVTEPEVSFSDLVLNPGIDALVTSVLREHENRELLTSRGIPPRHRLLFVGPSGTGKSQTAAAMAASQGVPLVKVRLAAVVSSFLGETAKNLDQILQFASYGRCVLLFDEVDMLGAERDSTDHGELRRVVAAFLQSLEEYQSHNIIVATSNHPLSLDSALWRRFDEVATFRPPTRSEIHQLLPLKFRKMKSRINRETTARALFGFTQAEIESVCLDAARSVLLDGRTTVMTDDVLKAGSARRRRMKEAGASPRQAVARSGENTPSAT